MYVVKGACTRGLTFWTLGLSSRHLQKMSNATSTGNFYKKNLTDNHFVQETGKKNREWSTIQGKIKITTNCIPPRQSVIAARMIHSVGVGLLAKDSSLLEDSVFSGDPALFIFW
jgi:hypothetical protein